MDPRSPQELDSAFRSYVDDVLGGRRITVGRLVHLAVERHQRDLELGGARGLAFDTVAAMRACWWIEHRVRFSKGEWARRPFVLEPWQLFVVANLFGWHRDVDGRWLRRFRTAYVSVARKNGKTEISAAIGLFMLTMCGESGAEVYSAATKRDQAAICWRAAAGMVKKSPLLSREIGVHDSRYNLSHYESESRFEALSADSNTLDGLSPYLAIVDELHAHPDGTVYDVLESGMGARRDPLMLAITTAGGKREGKCWDIETDAVKILEGIGESDGAGDDLFAFVARIDDGDDCFDERAWPKANPNLGTSVHLDKLRLAARTAKRRPSSLNEFRRKHCNEWTEVSTAWLPMPDWDACAGKTDLNALRGRRCWVGVDLSSTSDYTAACAVFEPDVDGIHDVLPAFWIPDETLFERIRTDRVPVEQWVRSGLVTATSGPVVDQDAVKDWLLNLRERYDIVEVPMDPHNATKLQTELMGLGFKVVNMKQGWVTMSPAIKHTEVVLRQKNIRHGGNPVLRWMFANVAVKRDERENLSLNKKRSADRIDGIVAMVMAIGRLAEAGPKWSGIYLGDDEEATA